MSDTIHNWNIEELNIILEKLRSTKGVLQNEKPFLEATAGTIYQDWKGKAGLSAWRLTLSDVNKLDSLTEEYTKVIEQLEAIISKCYSPCEEELRNMTSQLI